MPRGSVLAEAGIILDSATACDPPDDAYPHGARTRLLPPAPLSLLLTATLLLGCVWALVVPPFQAPDENAHVAYVQSLAEHRALPGDAARQFQSTEQWPVRRPPTPTRPPSSCS